MKQEITKENFNKIFDMKISNSFKYDKFEKLLSEIYGKLLDDETLTKEQRKELNEIKDALIYVIEAIIEISYTEKDWRTLNLLDYCGISKI